MHSKTHFSQLPPDYLKVTFNRICGHFSSIRKFFYFLKFLTKWLMSAILDVGNSLSIAYLAILDQYGFFFFEFFTKWLPANILDVRNSLSIAFLAISDRYATLIVWEIFDKMAAVGHFGCPKFTFDRISGRNFLLKFFTKWSPADILDVRKSLLIAFLAIPDRSSILDVWNSLSITIILAISDRCKFFFSAAILDVENHFRLNFWPFLIDLPFWMSEIHFRWHFWLFQIHMDLNHFVLNFWQNGRRRPFWMSENHFWSHFWPFQIDTQLLFL